jgi:hypothetical protein
MLHLIQIRHADHLYIADIGRIKRKICIESIESETGYLKIVHVIDQ